MKELVQKIQQPIAQELEEFKQFYRKKCIATEPIVNNIMQYLLASEGKLLRPIIILLTAKMFGDVNRKTYAAAAIIEQIHTATLIHDDIVDEADMRRGQPSVQAKWTPQIAVLAGDYLLANALNIINTEKVPDFIAPVTNAMKIISEGELFQITKAETLNATEDDYYKIIFKKTASLICASAKMGAMSASANNNDIANIEEIGKNIGIAFQIRDDIFDYETNNNTGKPYGNDIKEQKLTLPLIYALQKASEEKKNEIINKIYQSRQNHKLINEIIAFATENGGIKYAESKMQEYSNNAVAMLQKYKQSNARDAIISFAEYTAGRKK